MELTSFYDVRPFEEAVYNRNFLTLMGGYPVNKMPAFLTAGFVFDALRYSSPGVEVLGDLMRKTTPNQQSTKISLDTSVLIIVQRGWALLGRYISSNDNGNGDLKGKFHLQLYGRFERKKVDSLWPDYLVQFRSIRRTDSGTAILGDVHFSDSTRDFFTKVLAPGAYQDKAHARILASIP